jgi:hypothetical protein
MTVSAPLTEVRNDWTDLRGGPAQPVLRYPTDSVLVIAGIPGAGKSTLMHRLFGTTGAEPRPATLPDGVRVVDSEQARNRWRQLLGPHLPYWLYRPLVHLTALLWARSVLRHPGTVVVHDCGTRGWWRALITRWSRHRAGGVHLVLLDVPPELALDGQEARRRRVRRRAFGRHLRSWQAMVPPVGGEPVLTGFSSYLVMDRTVAAGVRDIHFYSSAVG